MLGCITFNGKREAFNSAQGYGTETGLYRVEGSNGLLTQQKTLYGKEWLNRFGVARNPLGVVREHANDTLQRLRVTGDGQMATPLTVLCAQGPAATCRR